MKVEIANRLYEYRKASGMSQEKLASLLGVSRQAVSKWECAESSPDTDNLIALAQLYGVSVDELLFAEPEDASTRQESRTRESLRDEQAENRQDEDSEPCALVVAKEAFDEDSCDEDSCDEGACTGEGSASGTRGDYASRTSDYVDISLENGVHVRDSKKGEEVHVGWDGIHIDTADDEHVHIDFGNFKSIAQAIRELRKSQR